MASKAERLRQQIRERLARGPGALDPLDRFLANTEGPVSRELLDIIERPGLEAAVLIPIIERADDLNVLLTERATHLRHHAGQICFPGGRLDHPEEGLVAAALREAKEEVGLEAHQVDIVGRLGPHLTGTGFLITPVIGFVVDRFVPMPDPNEVQAAFEVPLDHLLTPNNARMSIRERFGTRLKSYEFSYAGHRIWGVTAAIIMSFIEEINDL